MRSLDDFDFTQNSNFNIIYSSDEDILEETNKTEKEDYPASKMRPAQPMVDVFAGESSKVLKKKVEVNDPKDEEDDAPNKNTEVKDPSVVPKKDSEDNDNGQDASEEKEENVE